MGVISVKIIFTCSRSTLLIFYIMLLILVLLATVLFTIDGSSKVFAYNEQDRQAYLSELTIYNAGEPKQVRNFTVPWNFDNHYSKYNNIQLQAGFDLYKFAGEQLQEYTYEYNGYLIHLIIKNGEVVGGDITDPKYNGEVLPLTQNNANELNAS